MYCFVKPSFELGTLFSSLWKSMTSLQNAEYGRWIPGSRIQIRNTYPTSHIPHPTWHIDCCVLQKYYDDKWQIQDRVLERHHCQLRSHHLVNFSYFHSYILKVCIYFLRSGVNNSSISGQVSLSYSFFSDLINSRCIRTDIKLIVAFIYQYRYFINELRAIIQFHFTPEKRKKESKEVWQQSITEVPPLGMKKHNARCGGNYRSSRRKTSVYVKA